MREQRNTIELPSAWADDIIIWPLVCAAGTAPAGRLDDDDDDEDRDDDGPDPYDGVPADTRDALGRVWS